MLRYDRGDIRVEKRVQQNHRNVMRKILSEDREYFLNKYVALIKGGETRDLTY